MNILHLYTENVHNLYTSSNDIHVSAQMKGLDELITIFHHKKKNADMQSNRETSISMFCDRGEILMKTISLVYTSLVECYVTCDD